MLRCTLYSSYFVFCLYSIWPFQSNSFIFNCTLRTKVNINCNSWITSFPIPSFIIIFTKVFNDLLCFQFYVVWCAVGYFSILEGLEIKD